MKRRRINTKKRLPQLDPGINLLIKKTQENLGIQSLAIRHMMQDKRPGYWIDSKERASTTTMNRIIPDPDILKRIKVARAFTPHQHYTLIQKLRQKINYGDALVVVPETNWHYRDQKTGPKKRMIKQEINTLQELTNKYNVPILLSLHKDTTQQTKQLYQKISHRIIRHERTRMGPKFSTDNYNTYFYPANGYIQTTIDFWTHLLKQIHQKNKEKPPKQQKTHKNPKTTSKTNKNY